jgi:hypothetical protein
MTDLRAPADDEWLEANPEPPPPDPAFLYPQDDEPRPGAWLGVLLVIAAGVIAGGAWWVWG